mmetsp:Transcript_15367/g.33345  ORF Transcript_15367/g.33345 Transcript_15367/m.33345 type:complete len:322 (+) Transcript_15367:232-1197(+)
MLSLDMCGTIRNNSFLGGLCATITNKIGTGHQSKLLAGAILLYFVIHQAARHAPVARSFEHAERRREHTEERARNAPVHAEQWPRGVEDIVVRLQLGGHALETHGVNNKRHVVGVDRDTVPADQPQRKRKHLAELCPHAIPAARARAHHMHRLQEGHRAECVRAALFGREGEQVLTSSVAVATRNGSDEADEMQPLGGGELGDEAPIDERYARPGRTCRQAVAFGLHVDHDVSWMEIGVHHPVHQQHLKVDVDAPLHDVMAERWTEPRRRLGLVEEGGGGHPPRPTLNHDRIARQLDEGHLDVSPRSEVTPRLPHVHSLVA